MRLNSSALNVAALNATLVAGGVATVYCSCASSQVQGVPVAAGDASFSSVSLLLRGDGANGSTTIVDSSSLVNTVTVVGNAQVSTAVKKYGTGSIAFDGTGDYLAFANNASFELGTGDFTVEMWAYLTTTGNVTFMHGSTASTGNFGFNKNNSTLYIYTAGGAAVNYGPTWLYNQWVHYAITRVGTTLTLYINGVSQGTRTFSNNITGLTGSTLIGAEAGGANALSGYIDDLRITKLARYATAFTPPTEAFLGASSSGVTFDRTVPSSAVSSQSQSAAVAFPAFGSSVANSSAQSQSSSAAATRFIAASAASSQVQSSSVASSRQVACLAASGQSQSQSATASKGVVLVAASSQAQGVSAVVQNGYPAQSSQTQSASIGAILNVTCSVSSGQSQCVPAAWAGDPYWDSVVFAAHFDTDYADLKGHAVTGVSRVALGDGRFGGGLNSSSGEFSGVYLNYAASPDWDFGAGDFAVEFFHENTAQYILGGIFQVGAVRFYRTSSFNANLTVTYADTTTGSLSIASGLTWYEWAHWAVVRSGSTITLYKNGVSVGSIACGTKALAWNSSSSIVDFGTNDAGNLDEVRITKVARYTSNFSTPTAAFPNDAGGVGSSLERTAPFTSATQQAQSNYGTAQRSISLASASSSSQAVAGLVVEVHFCGTSSSQSQSGASGLSRGVAGSSVSAQAQASASAYIRQLNSFATAYQAQLTAGQTQRRYSGGGTTTSQSQSGELASWMGSSQASDFIATVTAASIRAVVPVTLTSVSVPPDARYTMVPEQQFEVTV